MTDAEFTEYFETKDEGRCVRSTRGIICALGPTLTKAIIDACERALGSKLPTDYRRWLLYCNGGIPKWGSDRSAYYAWKENGLVRASSVDTLLAIDHEDYGMDLVVDNGPLASSRPDGMISIGKPNFQNVNHRLLLCLDGCERGKVFEWWIKVQGKRKKSKPKGETEYELVERAASFEDFWDGLLTEFPDTPPAPD